MIAVARVTLVTLVVAATITLAGCSSLKLPAFDLPVFSPPPEAPPAGVEPSTAAIARIRASLLTLRSDPALAARVPIELTEAEALLQSADASQHDRQNGPPRIYIAERKAEQVRALAELRAMEAEYETLRRQRDALKGTETAR